MSRDRMAFTSRGGVPRWRVISDGRSWSEFSGSRPKQRVRLAGAVASLSLATDLATGQPLEALTPAGAFWRCGWARSWDSRRPI